MREILLCLLLAVPLGALAQKSDGSLFLLSESDGGWCGFRDEQRWTAEKESASDAPMAARVDYAGGRVAAVYVTSVDETGDWTTFDKYSLDKDGALTSLERTIDVYGHVREEQFWTIGSRGATKLKSSAHTIDTNQVIPEGKVWIPSPVVISEARNFPFWQLIRDKRSEIVAQGKVCEGGRH